MPFASQLLNAIIRSGMIDVNEFHYGMGEETLKLLEGKLM